jgi:Phospholipase_D-nuclease N-terminal
MLRVVAVVLILVVYVYGLVDAIRTDRNATRSISKTAWIVVMVLLPLLGAVLWFTLGKPYGRLAAPPQTYSHPTAPDDDPEFLRNLELRRRNQAEEERLRKLRQELDDKERKMRGESGAEDGSSS